MTTWRAHTVREFRKAPLAITVACLAVLVAVATGFVGGNGQAEANRYAGQAVRNAEEANRIAEEAKLVSTRAEAKVDAATRSAAVVNPIDHLWDGTCFRFSGHYRNVAEPSRIWIVVRAEGAPNLYLTEVDPDTHLQPAEIEQAQQQGETGWAAAVRVGDPARTELEKNYTVTLYWATSEQSETLRQLRGQSGSALPGAVEAQTLGEPIHLLHDAHRGAEPVVPCGLDNAG